MGQDYTNIIDSYNVDDHQMRVSGKVNLLDKDAQRLSYDGQVLIVLLGRVTTPAFTETKDADVIRVDVIKPIEAHVVSGLKEQRKIMDSLAFEHEAQGELSFADEEPVEESPPVTLLNIDSAKVPVKTGGFISGNHLNANGDLPSKHYDPIQHSVKGSPLQDASLRRFLEVD